jgi:hypothetical protein
MTPGRWLRQGARVQVAGRLIQMVLPQAWGPRTFLAQGTARERPPV